MADRERFNLNLENNDESFDLNPDQGDEDFIVDFGEVINTGAVTSYNELTNKPSINNVELRGDKTSQDLGLADDDDITDLQEQIDAITVSSDVVDVLGTYQDLLDYDTSELGDNDIVKVLQDSTHGNAMSYYRWNKTAEQWVYVGSEGPFYTKSESDTKFQDKLISGTNIKTINSESILGSGNINIESGYPEVPAKLYEYTNLLDLLNEPMYIDDGIYTVSQEWYCDIPKENDEWVNDNINPNSILYIYRPYGFISWSGPTSSMYWSNGDETFTGGILTTVDDVKLAIDEKIGDNYVTIGTDQTINSNKTIGKGKKLIFSGTSPNTSDTSIENNYGFLRFAHGSNEIMFIGSSGVYVDGFMSPNVTNSFNLGNDSNKWNTLYANKLNDGTNEKSLSSLLTNNSSLIPTSSSVYALGDNTHRWYYLYMSGNIEMQLGDINQVKSITANEYRIKDGNFNNNYYSLLKYKYGTSGKTVAQLQNGIDVNNMIIHNIPDTPDDGTSPINKNYADTNLQGKLTAGTGIAITNNVISSTLEGIDYEVDQELPQTGEKGIIYLIPNGSSEQENIYDEYIWIPPLQEGESGRFEFIGTTQTDLTNYVDLSSAQTISGNKTFSGTLYALGNISDGTNSVTVNKIANKDNFVTLSQADYDALVTKDPDTYYFIEEE